MANSKHYVLENSGPKCVPLFIGWREDKSHRTASQSVTTNANPISSLMNELSNEPAKRS